MAGRKGEHFSNTEDAGMLRSLASMEGEVLSVGQTDESRIHRWPGVLTALAVTAAAWGILCLPFAPFTLEGGRHPLGLSLLAMILGMVWSAVGKVPASVLSGLRWVVGALIPWAIVLLGAGIDARLLATVNATWWAGVPLLMATGFLGTFVLGRMLGLGKTLSALLGVGNAVCGSSAIMALAPVLMAKEEEVVLSVGVINLVGLFAMAGLFVVMAMVPIENPVMGYWAGASVQAVPQAIAVAESHSREAAGVATIVKLMRVLFLGPVILVTGHVMLQRKENATMKSNGHWLTCLPWFLWGFVAMVLLVSLGWLPTIEFGENAYRIGMAEVFTVGSKWLLAISLAAIGMQIKLGPLMLRRATLFVLGTGLLGWLVLSAAALFLATY